MLMILNSVWKLNKSGFRIFRRFSAVKINFYVEIVCENLQLLHSAFFSEFSCSCLLDSHELLYWFSARIAYVFIDWFSAVFLILYRNMYKKRYYLSLCSYL